MSVSLIRLPEVIKKTGKCRSSIYIEMAAGTFPRSVSIGNKSVAWVDDEITAWIDARIAERNEVAA